MNHPGHPVWSFLRLVVISTVAISALKYNATKFDWTEIESLLWILGVAGGLEGIGQLARDKSDTGHPIWGFLRFSVIGVVALISLHENATNFDWTEIRSLLSLLCAMAGIETAGQLARRRK